MDTLLEALLCASAPDRDSYRPMIFRMAVPEDRARLEDLLKSRPPIVVLDELSTQLTELVRAMQPARRFAAGELATEALAHLNGRPAHEYGVWVFYPWSHKLVHLLDEDEFVRVRTDRNRNKITTEEQALLATKKLGVIGLSVGQSVCLTLALERSFGELRIADFDTLDLSNLNRIRSGVHELGHSKVVNTAREIAELDPFLKVTVYSEGINEGNIHAFLTEGGNLDLLIEECDSVAVKIIARQQAKALRIPVVMDTSDRGMIDVERFDLEPERPILHGLIDHLDPRDAAKARTNEEKLPFVVPIAGMETLSARMKASMLEIESSVTTWPQLASSVVLGGGVTADTWRRIALSQFTASGRWFLDPEGVLRDPAMQPHLIDRIKFPIPQRPDINDLIALANELGLAPTETPFSKEQVIDLVEAGTLAPSGGNNQPWHFLSYGGRIFVFHDAVRSWSTIDPGSRYAHLGIGACLENIVLRAAATGVALNAQFTEASTPLVAWFERSSDTLTETSALAEFIPARCTNRKQSLRRIIPEGTLQEILAEASRFAPHVRVDHTTDPSRLAEIGRLCGESERIRFLNPACHQDMYEREMRFTAAQAVGSKDGIDARTLELKPSELMAMSVAGDRKAVGLLRSWGGGAGFTKMTSRLVQNCSALVMVSVADRELSTAVIGGRAIQRMWLAATARGIAAQPVSAPIFMGVHHLWDINEVLSAKEHAAAKRILGELTTLWPKQQHHPLFLLRLSIADEVSVRSLRLPVDEVLTTHDPEPSTWKG